MPYFAMLESPRGCVAPVGAIDARFYGSPTVCRHVCNIAVHGAAERHFCVQRLSPEQAVV
jgi:hypothetical protein